MLDQPRAGEEAAHALVRLLAASTSASSAASASAARRLAPHAQLERVPSAVLRLEVLLAAEAAQPACAVEEGGLFRAHSEAWSGRRSTTEHS